jgi:hypothetical protein
MQLTTNRARDLGVSEHRVYRSSELLAGMATTATAGFIERVYPERDCKFFRAN